MSLTRYAEDQLAVESNNEAHAWTTLLPDGIFPLPRWRNGHLLGKSTNGASLSARISLLEIGPGEIIVVYRPN
jgi:hypothetical protein